MDLEFAMLCVADETDDPFHYRRERNYIAVERFPYALVCDLVLGISMNQFECQSAHQLDVLLVNKHNRTIGRFSHRLTFRFPRRRSDSILTFTHTERYALTFRAPAEVRAAVSLDGVYQTSEKVWVVQQRAIGGRRASAAPARSRGPADGVVVT